MTPQQATNMAQELCRPKGFDVRYEWAIDTFRWHFYRGSRRVKVIVQQRSVIPAAQKLVDTVNN